MERGGADDHLDVTQTRRDRERRDALFAPARHVRRRRSSGNLLRALEDEAEQLARVNASLRADVAGLERAARAKDAALMAQAAELDSCGCSTRRGARGGAAARRAGRGEKLRAHAAALAKQLRARRGADGAGGRLEALRAARDARCARRATT